jgi:hypothetical protein
MSLCFKLVRLSSNNGVGVLADVKTEMGTGKKEICARKLVLKIPPPCFASSSECGNCELCLWLTAQKL